MNPTTTQIDEMACPQCGCDIGDQRVESYRAGLNDGTKGVYLDELRAHIKEVSHGDAIEAMQDRLATLGQAKWVYDLCQSAGIEPTPLVTREATGRDE